MEGVYPIIINGGVCGKLRVEKAGGYTRFTAECPPQGGVIRLSVYGGGKEGYLGVPMPVEGALRLEKKLSGAAMRDFPTEIDHCGLAGERPEKNEPEPEKTEEAKEEACTPEELSENAGECEEDCEGPFWYATTDGALVSRDSGVEMVALPTGDERVPDNIPGRRRIIEGKEYLVYITKEKNSFAD